MSTKTLEISGELYEKVENRAVNSNFESADEYAEYLIRSVLQQFDPVDELADEEAVKDRLQSLGYLDT
ncbi:MULTISPECIES: hypothetical protein [Haloarcula]|uniref:hypothetical protein n=1 Tax=Haloarcula TaxID=2237 RepID=UPI0023EB5E91|nr:hypothetical protein [Halomicroarcula sp. XH51]